MSLESIRAELDGGRQRLLRAISGVTEEQFKRRPPDGGWSIAEVLAHQLASETLWAGRIRLALRQDGAAAEPVSPEDEEAQARAGRTAPVPQLIHGLLAARREIELLLDEAAAMPGGLDRAVAHPRLGRLSVAVMASKHVGGHEAEHAGQIEALKASLQQ